MTCCHSSGASLRRRGRWTCRNGYRIDISKNVQTLCSICNLRKPGNTKIGEPATAAPEVFRYWAFQTARTSSREEEMIETCSPGVGGLKCWLRVSLRTFSGRNAHPVTQIQSSGPSDCFTTWPLPPQCDPKRTTPMAQPQPTVRARSCRSSAGKTSCTDGTRSSARLTVLALCRTVNVDCSLPLVTSFRAKDTTKKARGGA